MSTPHTHTGNSRGFTLVEMMVVVMILGMVSIGLFQVLVTSRDSYEQQKITLEMQQNARAAIEGLADDFRHVSYGKDPTQPSIHYAANDSVTFVADIVLSAPGAEVITYALSPDGDLDTPNPNDTVLIKTVSDTAGVVLYQEAQSYGIKIGGLSLRYFNGAGVELANNPVPQPELIGEVLIEVTAVEPREHKRHGTYLEETLSTTIYPRNLPLTPARSRPSMPLVGPLSCPNCESITVPWTTPTTNTDGTPLPLADISHFTIFFGTHPDTMSMYSRVARTINVWTIPDLTAGHVYYMGVTCASRSGVESYMGTDNISLTSSQFPQVPTNFVWGPNPSGSGIRLDWNQVTLFTDSSPITTPVDYNIYRSTSPGVTPSAVNLLGTVQVQNWLVDSTLTTCTPYYYIVTAVACANESSPATELSVSTPAPPDCVLSVSVALTPFSGEIDVAWVPPTQRNDGSPLAPGDITAYRVYYNTSPFTYTLYFDVSHVDTTYTIVGLMTCTTYYVNVATFDACPNLGDICTFNEVSINTSIPCDPDVPATPLSLRAIGMDQRIDLVWPANLSDCDLDGYKVWYGTNVGGPYVGNEALEGPSPITFPPAAITGADDTCRVSLTGMTTCQNYASVVTTIDGCTPPNESPASPEATAQTECMACDIDAGCAAYMTTAAAVNDIRLELYPTSGIEETLAKLTGTWSGPGLISQVWTGRPLVCIWNSDGSAGEDGPIGDQPSGIKLDVDNADIPAGATESDGLPLRLFFDHDMGGHTLALDYQNANDRTCGTAERDIRDGLAFDDFDDGDASDWTFTHGNWSVVAGELYQSNAVANEMSFATYPGTYTDGVLEVKLNCVSGSTAYILFRADVSATTFYMFGLVTDSNIVRLCKYESGAFSVVAQTGATLSNNTWYQLRVEVRGSTVTAYLDCAQVLEVTDPAMLPSGSIGVRTWESAAYFDDFRGYTWVPG